MTTYPIARRSNNHFVPRPAEGVWPGLATPPHSALRARRPVVWFPKDDLGVSDDEVRRGKAVSEYVAMSNEGADLDRKGKVTFDKSPPDFSNVDLIAL